MVLSVGTVVAGYTIEGVLGAGGMGTVYPARNPSLPRSDALKVLSSPRPVGAVSLAVLTAAVTVLAGCSSTVTGTAAPESGFKPGDAVPALLNPGNYPTKPHAKYGKAGTDGVVFEGQRMAEFVVGPWDVDPALIQQNPFTTTVWRDAPALTNFLLGSARGAIAGVHGFLVGFSSQRTSTPPGQIKGLTNAVLRFPAPADATAAATEMGQPTPADFDIGNTPEVPIAIPGHPETVAVSYAKKDNTAAVASFTAHGPYVLNVGAEAQGNDLATATALVSKTLDLQAPRIDGFTPTPPDQLGDLPVDPDGLAALTLPLAKTDRQTLNNGVWGSYATLHYAVDPVKSALLYAGADMQRWAYIKSMVWETKDADGAQKLLKGLVANDAGSTTSKPAAGVPGLPSAKCFSDTAADPTQPSFNCYYAVDRFVVNVASRQNVDVQQQAAAQYLILTAK